jgi:hypothetical protein
MRFAPLLLVTGCFYVDPINQSPSAGIKQLSSDEVFRNEHVSLTATTYDPEGQQVYVRWRVYACTDATTPAGCDVDPFSTAITIDETFDVPVNRADNVTPTSALRVILEVTDDHGATAKPDQQLLLSVVDQPPEVMMSTSSRHSFVVGTPIDVYAKVSDVDDGAAALAPLVWQVYSPAGTPPTLVDKGEVTPGDPTQFWQILTPYVVGKYTIDVTATDPFGVQQEVMLPIQVGPDEPPCLTQWAPLAAPAGSVLPLQDPTLIEVLVVEDDLDPYPAVGSDPVLGQTSFSWSILPPGASSRQPLSGIVGNSVAFDPASYKPGDVVELRVEIQDRITRPILCPDSDPTCSVNSDPTCIQRLTWRVEVQ